MKQINFYKFKLSLFISNIFLFISNIFIYFILKNDIFLIISFFISFILFLYICFKKNTINIKNNQYFKFNNIFVVSLLYFLYYLISSFLIYFWFFKSDDMWILYAIFLYFPIYEILIIYLILTIIEFIRIFLLIKFKKIEFNSWNLINMIKINIIFILLFFIWNLDKFYFMLYNIFSKN